VLAGSSGDIAFNRAGASSSWDGTSTVGTLSMNSWIRLLVSRACVA
jgi:hypothetical protein